MSAIENLCPRAIWIEGGEIREDGEAKDVIRAYLSMFADRQRSGYDFTKIESRGGNGMVRYTGIEFLDADGHPNNLVRSGDELRVRLHFHAREEIHQPHFGVMIYSDMGTLVTTISTWAAGLEIPALAPGRRTDRSQDRYAQRDAVTLLPIALDRRVSAGSSTITWITARRSTSSRRIRTGRERVSSGSSASST